MLRDITRIILFIRPCNATPACSAELGSSWILLPDPETMALWACVLIKCCSLPVASVFVPYVK